MLKTKGKVLFQAWVTPDQAEQIKALLDGGQAPYHLPTPPRRKRRRKIDTVVEKNREIFEAHQDEIT